MWCLIEFCSWNLRYRKFCTDPGYFGIYPCKISYMYARIRAVQSSSSYVAMNFVAGKCWLALWECKHERLVALGFRESETIKIYKTGGPRGFVSDTLQNLWNEKTLWWLQHFPPRFLGMPATNRRHRSHKRLKKDSVLWSFQVIPVSKQLLTMRYHTQSIAKPTSHRSNWTNAFRIRLPAKKYSPSFWIWRWPFLGFQDGQRMKNQTISKIYPNMFCSMFWFFLWHKQHKKTKQKKAKKENAKNDVRADVSFQCGIGVVAKAAAAIRPTEAEPAKSEREVKHFQLRDATKNIGKTNKGEKSRNQTKKKRKIDLKRFTIFSLEFVWNCVESLKCMGYECHLSSSAFTHPRGGHFGSNLVKSSKLHAVSNVSNIDHSICNLLQPLRL